MSPESGGSARPRRRDAIAERVEPGSAIGGIAVKDALTPAIHLRPRSFSYIDQRLIDRLERRLQRQSLAGIMRNWGISANTWTKLRAGEPVRTSLAERLVERVIAHEDRGREA